jgi:hypothetical protein
MILVGGSHCMLKIVRVKKRDGENIIVCVCVFVYFVSFLHISDSVIPAARTAVFS